MDKKQPKIKRPGKMTAEYAAALKGVRVLQQAGHTAYWAGGCVRDMLLGRPPRDYDVATDALPERVAELFPHSRLVGKAFGVVLARCQGLYLEVATFRRDVDYRNGRHPDRVEFCDAPADARRRDFTINAVFYDPITREIHDFVEGQRDLDAKIVRCVGEPAARFGEDHLRIMRAVRFATTLGFEIEPATREALREFAPSLKRISAERIRDELTRTLLEAVSPGAALRLLQKLGILEVILPEVDAMVGQEQPPRFHPEGDVFEHTVLMLDEMRERDKLLTFSVLLHDVGKPVTAAHDGHRIRFNRHAEEGADIARGILKRLRFSVAETEAICACIRHHMSFMNVPRMRESTLRKMIARETFPLELELHRLDCVSSHRKMGNYERLVSFRDALAHEPVLPDPWITGHDLLAMGVPPGPEVGRWHRRAFDTQLENRFDTRAELLEWLARMVKKEQEQET